GQHVVGDGARITAPRTPDADAQPQELLRTQRLGDRAKAVVAGEPAAEPGLQAAFLQVDVVVHHEESAWRHLEEPRRRADRTARLVYVRLRLQKSEAEIVQPHLGESTRELRPPRAPEPGGELLRNEPAHVVPCGGVLAPGIPETRDEQIERRGALAPTDQAHGLALVAGGLGLFGRLALFRGSLGDGFLALGHLGAFL